MFSIIVTEKGGDQRRLDFDKAEVTIGRVQGNDIVLPKGNVSKRHARIVLKDGKFIIVDLKSTNGTYVNGRKITSPLVVKDADKIYIGDFILGVDAPGRAGAGAGAGKDSAPNFAPPPTPPPGPPAPLEPPMPTAPPARPSSMGPAVTPPRPPAPPPARISAPQPVQNPLDALDDSPSAPNPMPGPPPPMPAPMPPPGPAPRPTAPLSMQSPSGLPPISVPSSIPSAVPNMAPPPVVATPPSTPAIVPPSGPVVPPGPPGPPGPPRAMEAPAPAARRPAPTSPPPSRRDGSQPRLIGAGAPRSAPVRPMGTVPSRGVQVPPLDSQVVRRLELQESLLVRLVPRLDLDNIPIDRLGDDALWQKTESAIVDLVETMDSSGDLPPFIDQDTLIKETLNEALGFGPLEDLLADESVEEIIVDRRDRILVSKSGKLGGSGKAFSSDESLRRVIERLVAPTGKPFGESSPVIDIRLRDGSRLTAAVPPVAVRGACLTLRKPRARAMALAELVANGALSTEMAAFLTACVTARRNVVVCGAPGVGKSMVLTAMASAIPAGERIVSVEEVAELSLGRDEWIALEARPGDGDRVPEIGMAMLLRSALRMRPDRLVVGDVRGPESLELVSALATSIDGALVSIAGDGVQSALGRLTAMARLTGPSTSADALRDCIAAAVDVVVHVARYADGVMRIAAISEVTGVRDGGFDAQDIFTFRGTAEGGGFVAAGVVPSFYGELEARGVGTDASIFRA